jgi:asparagine synthase (glutamine-hydrolysing)
MAFALEARVPFLDPNVIAFAARLPLGLRVGGGVGKRVLRQLLGKYLDPKMFERPKQGFAIPLGAWLRGPLREWGESLLSREALTRTGLLDADFVRQHWDAHVSGSRNLHYPLWNFLMLQAWVAEYRPRLS